MKISIWHHTADKQPDKSGHYLCYRGWGIGGKSDSDSDHGYLYYNKGSKCWQDYRNGTTASFVYYWTDADPQGWVDNDPPVVRRKKEIENVALNDAWKSVQDALEKYEMIRTLVK